jgi:hypothetical protein
MRSATFAAVLAFGLVVSGCTKKDADVVNRKESTLDTFEFTPKSATELAASAPGVPASRPTSATADAAARPTSAPSTHKGSTLDTFVFKPKSAAELARQRDGK